VSRRDPYLTLEDREFMSIQTEYAKAMMTVSGPSEELIERRRRALHKSNASSLPWFCHRCKVEVKQLRCPHCGKAVREKS